MIGRECGVPLRRGRYVSGITFSELPDDILRRLPLRNYRPWKPDDERGAGLYCSSEVLPILNGMSQIGNAVLTA